MQSVIPSFGSSSTARHAASSIGLWEMQQPKTRPAKFWRCTCPAGPALHVGKLCTAVANAATPSINCQVQSGATTVSNNREQLSTSKMQTKRHVDCTGSTAANHVFMPTQLIKGFMWRRILRHPSRFCSKMQSGYNRCICVICTHVCMCMYVCVHTHICMHVHIHTAADFN